MTAALVPIVRIQSQDFDTGAELQVLCAGRRDIGAVVTFSGLCRDEAGTLAALDLEHYPAMAHAEILRIASQAMSRWPLLGLTVIHRFGRIAPGENIVLVAAASSHRRAAFDAAAYLMDYLKTDAPFWKKEYRVDGSSDDWVEAKSADVEAAKAWKSSRR